MDINRFDRLTKRFASGACRRSVLKGLTAGAVVSTFRAGLASAQQSTPAPQSSDPGFGQEFLFVQTFTGGTFAANPEAGAAIAMGTPEAGVHGAYLLSLGGHPGLTVYFSDRPERIVGDLHTDQFVAGLGFGADDPPNAALVTQNDDGQAVVAVMELLHPVVDLDAGTVVYEANLLDDYVSERFGHLIDQQETDVVPAVFGTASLFIDACDPASPYCKPYP